MEFAFTNLWYQDKWNRRRSRCCTSSWTAW